MVERILNFLNKETSGLHSAAYLLAFFALLSQVLALIRDKLLALTFGAGPQLDLYYAAFRIPDFIFVTVGSIVSLSVLVPFLIERMRMGESETRLYINSIFSFFLVTVLVACLVVFIFASELLSFVFPGFPQGSFVTLVSLMRILLVSPILLGVSSLFAGLSQSTNRFLVYGLSPVVYNIGIILGIIFLYPALGLPGLAFGVLIGALLHLLVQFPAVRKIGMFPRITLHPDFNLIKSTVVTSIPRTLALSFNHLSILILLSFASLLSVGSIAVFNLSLNLQSVPLSIIGVSYSLAAFPALSRMFAGKDTEGFYIKLTISLRHIIFWSLPFAVLFVVLRAHIVRIILGSGEFDWTDTRLTAAALAMFVISVLFQSLNLLFIRGFYAMGNTRVPLFAGILSVFVTILSAQWLIGVFERIPVWRFFIEQLFKVSGLPGTEVLMLPLAYTLGSFVSCLVLWWLLERRRRFSRTVIPTLFQSLSASVIMGFTIFLALRIFDNMFSLEHFWGLFAQASLSAVIGVTAGILVLVVLGNLEIKDIWRILHQKFWKTKVVGPDPEVV
jgi:putative peptidoglycan lipid II flippase